MCSVFTATEDKTFFPIDFSDKSGNKTTTKNGERWREPSVYHKKGFKVMRGGADTETCMFTWMGVWGCGGGDSPYSCIIRHLESIGLSSLCIDVDQLPILCSIRTLLGTNMRREWLNVCAVLVPYIAACSVQQWAVACTECTELNKENYWHCLECRLMLCLLIWEWGIPWGAAQVL